MTRTLHPDSDTVRKGPFVDQSEAHAKRWETKDSGLRVQFDSGFTRDIQDGKPRYDLVPLPLLKRLAELYARGAEKYTIYGECNCNASVSATAGSDAALATNSSSVRATLNTPSVSEKIVADGPSETPRAPSEDPDQRGRGLIAGIDSSEASTTPSWSRRAGSAGLPPSTSTTTTRMGSFEEGSVIAATSVSGTSKVGSPNIKGRHSPGCGALTIVSSGENNWRLADPFNDAEMQRFKASAFRHLVQWMDGESDEDHASAVVFNVWAWEWVASHSPKRALQAAPVTPVLQQPMVRGQEWITNWTPPQPLGDFS